MNILMMTNTYTPFVGGVARSVEAFTTELRRMGHRVVVVAPVFDDMPESETDVIRVPALQHFNGSDFSVVLPIPGLLSAKLEHFKPDIVHSHHPYLLGGTAVRVARRFECPLVFTHHTMYEHYLHYVPSHAKDLKGFVINLVMGYCNLCDHIIAPSQSVAEILAQRGVQTPMDVIPTGVYTEKFERGSGKEFRRVHGIPEEALVAGYVGRLAPEKNLSFLAQAMRRFVSDCPQGHFLVVGAGDASKEVDRLFNKAGVDDRLHRVGALEGQALTDAYHAMDVFVFASHTETQGMVLTEAMAADRPVVALDAPGTREVVTDGVNGRLLESRDSKTFAQAAREIVTASASQRQTLCKEAHRTADRFSMKTTSQSLLDAYGRIISEERRRTADEGAWSRAIEEVKAEWDLIKNVAEAATETLKR